MACIRHSLRPLALVGALVAGCAGAPPEPDAKPVDPGQCRRSGPQMILGQAETHEVGAPGGTYGHCWRLRADAGRARIAVNFDAPGAVTGARMLLTDDIGRPIEPVAESANGDGRFERDISTASDVIVIVQVERGRSTFGIKATRIEDAPIVVDETEDEDGPESDEPAPGPDAGKKPERPGPPPPPPPIEAVPVRITANRARTSVDVTVRLAPDDMEQVDWSAPIRLVDGSMTIEAGTVTSRTDTKVELRFEGVPLSRAQECTVRLTRRPKSP